MRKSIISVMGFGLVLGVTAVEASVHDSATHVTGAGLVSPEIHNVTSAPAKIVKLADAAQITDGEIAYIYLQGNLFDVEEAELAISRGTAAEVREQGEMVVRDHRGVVKAFEDILAKNGITKVELPIGVTRDDRHSRLGLVRLDPSRVSQSRKETIERQNARLTGINPIKRSLPSELT